MQKRTIALLLGIGFFSTIYWAMAQSSAHYETDHSDQGLAITRHFPVRSDILAIELARDQVDYAVQVPYTPQPADRIKNDGQNVWLYRKGKIKGSLVGSNRDILYGFDRLKPAPGSDRFTPERSEQPHRYRLSSPDDPAYAIPQKPQAVFRKSRPVDSANIAAGETIFPLVHSLYFQWSSPLKPGLEYQLTATDGSIKPLSFRHESHALSDAIHVSHVGFRPDDPKLAFLSSWLGSGGGLDYEEGLTFELVDSVTGEHQYQGKVKLRRLAEEGEDPRNRNYNHTSVYALEFDDFTQPGTYQLCVETVGCSYEFAIAANPWREAFITAARGFYYQRSGIALKAPHSEQFRPKPFYPDSRFKVYQSKTPLWKTGNGLTDTQDNFAELVAGKTDQLLPQAWGGYFDAADWDRRIQHLDAARLLLELLELFPNTTAQIDLNLPDSTPSDLPAASDRHGKSLANADLRSAPLPDLLDEALWGLAVFRRMQSADGGIRGGIESAEHPRRGEASWQESLPVMAYAPGVWSSYVYSGVAARAARVLQPFDSALAQDYRRSAEAAMLYAEQTYAEQQGLADELPTEIADARNLAAVELWRLTAESRWHELFLATTVFTDNQAPLAQWQSHDQRHAAFIYASQPQSRVNRHVQASARRALLSEAQESLELSQATGFAWTRMAIWQPMGWSGGLGNPKLTTLLRAHAITKDEKYLKTALRAGQFSVGANPLNMTFTTGVGHRYPQYPLVIDQRILGQKAAPGITVYGPIDLQQFNQEWGTAALSEQVYPSLQDWPATESYFDMYLFPPMTEFTIHETMAPLAYAWGYFTGREQSLSTGGTRTSNTSNTQ